MGDTSVFGSNWKEWRSKIRPRWTAMSDADVEAINGQVDTLVELLRERYGYTLAQAQIEVERFLKENGAKAPAHRS